MLPIGRSDHNSSGSGLLNGLRTSISFLNSDLNHQLLTRAETNSFTSAFALIDSEAVCQEKDALAEFGLLVGHDDCIAPVRHALAVVSVHGTSTQVKEKNETSVYNDVFTNIGRMRAMLSQLLPKRI